VQGGGLNRSSLTVPVNKRISREHFWESMKLILVAFIILLLVVPVYGQKTAEDFFNEGYDHLSSGHYSANQLAIWSFDESIKLDPKHAWVWYNRGFAYHNLGKYEKAFQDYDEATRLDPNHIDSWINKGAALNALGRYFEAIVACDVAIRLDISSVGAWNNKGNALKGLGRYGEAVNAYDEVLVLYPSYVDALCNKGLALALQGRYEESVQVYDEALRLDPNNVNARNNKEASLCRLGKCTNANENVNPGNAGGSYLANSDTKVYHYPSCASAQKIHPENRIWFSNSNEARSAGYRPCEKCNPQ
jgi:tetratricopeptide (TPR) repeat protein